MSQVSIKGIGGYWRVLEFIDLSDRIYNRSEIPLIVGELALDRNGNIVRKRTQRRWSLGWSRRVTKERVESINTGGNEIFERQKQNIMQIVVDSEQKKVVL